MAPVTELSGHRLIAEGREAEIYEWGDGLVLRLMRSPDTGPVLVRSTAASEAARAAGVSTPKVHEIIEVAGRPAQVLERVDGPDMFAHIAAQPLRMVSAARTLARVHAELHEVEAPTELEAMHLHLNGRIAPSELIPSDVKDRALEVLADLAPGTAICHGDFHPGNVLLTDAGPVLIDWSNAVRGDAAADFARTRLMLRVGEVPPEAPRMIRALAAVGRGLLLRIYERTYRKLRPVDMDLVERWTLVCIAARLDEEIVEERPALLDMARRHLV